MSVVLVGGVEVSRQCLEALARAGVPIALAIGYAKEWAGNSGYADLSPTCARLRIPLHETADINSPDTARRVRKSGARLMVVTGWSQLLRRPLMELCALGTVGMHPTRLPEGRGRAPIPWTLIKGLRRSAVTLFHLTEGVDDGDIVGQIEFDVTSDDDAASLYTKVSEASVRLVTEYVPKLLAGTARRVPQDHGKATYWPRRRPEDGLVDWSRPAGDLYNWVRGLARPYPGAFTHLRGNKIIIWKARLAAVGSAAAPGTVTAVGPDGIVVACGDGAVSLAAVSVDGRDMSAAEAAASGIVRSGDILGGERPCDQR